MGWKKFVKSILITTITGIFITFSAMAEGEIKIGFIPSTTGGEAGEAKNLIQAIHLAAKQINASGGIKGKKVKIVQEDGKSTPQGAKEAYDRLIDEKVASVVTGYKSAQLVAVVPKSLTSNTPTFIGGTNPKLTADGKWLFRTRPDDRIAAAAMTQFIKESTKFTKLGIIHDNGAFGKGGADYVTKYAADLGLSVVKRVGFDIGTSEFSAPMKEIKDAGAEVLIVYVANLDESAGIQLEHAKMGKPFYYLGSPSSQAKLTLEIAKDAADGIHSIVDFVFGESPESKKYAAEYKAEYKEEPDSIAAYTYDGVMIFANAVKAVGEDPLKIREYIMNTKYKGVMGHYSFAPNGDGLHSVSIVEVKNGVRKLLKVVTVK